MTGKIQVKVHAQVKGGTLLGYQASVTLTWPDGEVSVKRGPRRKRKEAAEAEMNIMLAQVDQAMSKGGVAVKSTEESA